MNRRSFMQAILAASIAPAVVRAANLMPVHVLQSGLLVLYGDGAHDDSEALQAWINGESVVMVRRPPHDNALMAGTFLIKSTIEVKRLPPWGSVAYGCRFVGPAKPLMKFSQGLVGSGL